MADKQHDEPQFDYSNYSRGDQRKLFELNMDMQYLAAQIDENTAHMSRAEYDAAKAEYFKLSDEITALELAHVTYVPRDWFVSSAPDGVSVKTPRWWQYLRADKSAALRLAATEARSPAAVSGN